MESNIC